MELRRRRTVEVGHGLLHFNLRIAVSSKSVLDAVDVMCLDSLIYPSVMRSVSAKFWCHAVIVIR